MSMTEEEAKARLRLIELNQQSSPSASAEPQITEEMHPDVSTWDRMIAKNLGAGPEQQAGYLQKKYPDLEVAVGPKGKVLLRNKGETGAYKVLDPDTGFFSKDFGHDLLDLPYDIAAGLGTTAASAAAGAAGGLASGGLGAIPSAMAAGGAAGAGFEGLRQGLGSAMGVPDNFDPTGIALSGGFGAAAPALFGTGANMSKVAAKSLEQSLANNVPKNVALETARTAAQSQSGLPMRGLRAAAPGIGEFISGVDKNVLSNYAKNFGEVEGFNKTGITPLAERTGKDITKGIQEQRREIGQQLNDVITQSGEQINLRPAKSAIQDKIESLQKNSMRTQAEQDQINELKDMYNHFFKYPEQEVVPAAVEGAEPTTRTVMKDIPDEVGADQALALQMRLKDPANLARVSPMSSVSRNANKSLGTQQFENVAGDAVRDISNEIDQTVEDSILKSIDNSEARGVETPRDLKNAYRTWSQYGRQFKNNFKDAGSTYRTLTSLDSPSKVIENEALTNIDKQLGTDTVSNALKMKAHATFNKPSWLPISSKGTVSTGRVLTAAGGGYLASGGERSNPVYGALGGLAAAAAAGPQAMKLYIRANRGLQGPWGQALRTLVQPSVNAYINRSK